ncbi:hypothetical protein NDU88_002783 [Pleurodeles waltl]|uniref:Uncharacterized protein n=1 Tax=Pleurodeles waltl TaxID=8319 RepID=A0AAV7TLN5_PLEWA|nr:hypothetical protein NDU88_002783 [Pleurodeles waltl]
MDPRVRQAMQLLKEAGRLDLLVEVGARHERPAHQAASGVAAAVAACSPPRGSGGRRATQVRGLGFGKGQAGKASAPARRVVSARVQRPGPLGARPPASVTKGRAGGVIGSDPPAVFRAGGMASREPRPLGARQAQGGLPKRAGEAKKAGLGALLNRNTPRMPGGASPVYGARSEQVGAEVSRQMGRQGGWEAGGSVQGGRKMEKGIELGGMGVGGGGLQGGQGGEKEGVRWGQKQDSGWGFQWEWSDEEGQEVEEEEGQEVEEDGITLKVRPPLRTYGGVRSGEKGQVLSRSSSSDSVELQRGGVRRGKQRGAGLDDGFLLTDTLDILQGEKSGSEKGDPGEPWAGSEPWEEEKAGPSAAGWIDSQRGGSAVRAKALVQRSQPGLGVAPTRKLGARAWGFDVLSLGTGAGGDRERAHDRGERAG